MTPEDLITPREAAKIVRAHISTVHRWIQAGTLPAWCRQGQRYLVSRADVDRLVCRVVPLPELTRTADEEQRHEKALEELRAMGLKV